MCIRDSYRAEMIDREASLSVAIFEYFSGRGNACGENPLYQQYLSSRRMWEELIQYGIDRKEFYQVDKTAVFDPVSYTHLGRAYRIQLGESKAGEAVCASDVRAGQRGIHQYE